MAKKPFNVLSATALAAVLASSAIVPTAVFAAETTQSVQNVIVEHEGEIFELSYEDYTNAKSAGVNFGEVKYVVSSNGKQYKYSDFTQAKPVGSTVDGTLELLEKDPTNVQDVTPGKVIIGEDGKPEYVPPVVNEDFEVTDIAAINDTSVTVNFPSNSEVKEADLEGKTITLKSGETTLTATYKAGSLADGKATFALSESSKLVDATMYTVSAEGLTFANADFVAKVATEFVAGFEKVTTAITAAGSDGVKQNSTVTFSAVNQYGEDIAFNKVEDLDVNVTLNGALPLVKDAANKAGFTVDKTNGKVTIEKALAENDVVEIELVNSKTVDAKKVELAKNEFTFTVQKAEASVVKSVSLTPAKTSLPAKEGTELDVKVLDQFSNALDNTPSEVTFVVNGKIVVPGADKSIQYSNGKYTFKTTTPGEYKIVAISAKDSKIKATATISVGAATLTDLIVDKTIIEDVTTPVNERFNKEDIVVATVKPSEGAALTPENLKFNVTTTSTGLTKDDVTVTAETQTVGTGDEAKDVIVVKANAAKSGTFTVTPYVGESFVADKVIKGDAITFTTKKNPKVESISAVNFEAKELKVGATVKKDIVFKNVNGETVLPTSDPEAGVTVSSSNKNVAEGKVVTIPATETEAAKSELQITGKATAGTTVITVQAGDKVATYTLKFVASKLAIVNAGADITGVVSGDTDAKYNALQFLDQDGVSIGAQAATVTVKDAEGVEQDESSLVTLGEAVKEDTDDKNLITGIKTDDVTKFDAIQVKPVGLDKGTYTVTVTSGEGKDAVSDTFTVEVGAERVADTVEVATENDTVVIGGTTEVMITPKDQYGKLVTYADMNINKYIKVVGDNTNATVEPGSVKKVTKGDLDSSIKDATKDDVVGYKVTVTGATKGSTGLKVNVTDGTDTPEGILATSTQTINVGTTAALVDKVEIKEKEGTQNASSNGVQLDAVVKDKNGKVVNVKPTDLTWSITGLKDAEGNVIKGNFDNGVFTTAGNPTDSGLNDIKVNISSTGVITSSDNKLDNLTVDVAVKVETQNFKEATTSVKITTEGKKYTSDFKVDKIYNGGSIDADKKVEFEGNGTSATITDGTQEITFTFSGLDQYGDLIDINTELADGTLATSDENALKATWAQGSSAPGTLTVKALNTDGGEVYVKVGKETLTLNIDVAGDAKTIIEANNDVATAKAAVTAADFTNLEVADTTSDADKKAAIEVVVKTLTLPSGVTATVNADGSKVTLEKANAENVEVNTSASFKLNTEAVVKAAASASQNNGAVSNWMNLENLSTTGTNVTADFTNADNAQIKAIYDGLGDKNVDGKVIGADGKSKDAYDYAIDSYVMNTFARYAGALHRVNEGKTISTITFNGENFTWSGTAKGSNWKNESGSLVSKVAVQQNNAVRDVNLTINGKTVNFKATNVPVKADVWSE